MGLKSLLCVFLIFLSLPVSISSTKSPSNSTSPHSKQASLLLHGLRHRDETKTDDIKHSSMDTEGALAHIKDGDIRIHSYMRKGGHGKGGGANSASHHTPSSRKNLASSLSPPSSFIFSMLPCTMIFGFFFFGF